MMFSIKVKENCLGTGLFNRRLWQSLNKPRFKTHQGSLQTLESKKVHTFKLQCKKTHKLMKEDMRKKKKMLLKVFHGKTDYNF